MLKQHASKIVYLNVLTDIIFTTFSFLFAQFFRHITLFIWSYGGSFIITDFLVITFILSLWGVISYYFHSKRFYRFTSLQTEMNISLQIATLSVVCILLFQYLLKWDFFPRSFLLIFFVSNVIFLIFGKFLQRNFIGMIQKKGFNTKSLLIVGLNARSRHFIKTINRNKEWGLVPIGAVDTNGHHVKTFQGIPVKGNAQSFRTILHENPLDEVIFAFSFSEYQRIKPLMNNCEEEGVHYILLSDFFSKKIGTIYTDEIFGQPILYFSPTPKQQILWKIVLKRIVDIILSSLLLIVTAPIMLLIVIFMYLTMGRPIFYQWNVIGFNKKPIRSWKFRTMVPNADELKKSLESKNEMTGPVFKITNDPRVTPLGKFLRKYSLDELPQFWSVLKGDLSMVGPRPAGPHELKRYKHWHRRKLSIKPGLTCLWQVNGRNGIHDFDKWAKLDLEYIDNWSLLLDLKILLKTIPAVLNGTGK